MTNLFFKGRTEQGYREDNISARYHQNVLEILALQLTFFRDNSQDGIEPVARILSQVLQNLKYRDKLELEKACTTGPHSTPPESKSMDFVCLALQALNVPILHASDYVPQMREKLSLCLHPVHV